jgi:PucR family transcriptional regulator, purine catabolism regulatory protein
VLTVQELAGSLDLRMVAGRGSADAPIRWVHITELPDPTPWLSGGELVLTTGLQLTEPDLQRSFVRRLAQHHLAGLGFGVGIAHDSVPKALVDEAEALDFPLFEVPYEMPFIAITEKAFGRLVNEQYEVLQRGIVIHKRLEQLVLDERGLDEVARALAAAIGGAVAVLDRRGAPMSHAEFHRSLSDEAFQSIRGEISAHSERAKVTAFSPEHQSVAGRALALPVGASGTHGPQAWLVAVRDGGGLGDFERLILQQAVTVVALELMRRRTVRDTERRLAGDVLEEVLSGAVPDHEVETRLRPFGVGNRAAVLLAEVEDAAGGQAILDAVVTEHGSRALVAVRDNLVCAVVAAAEGTGAETLAETARTALAERFGRADVAVSRGAPVTALRRSYHEARCALDVSRITDGNGYRVATYEDLGAFRFLLSVQDDDALRIYADSVIGPLANGEGEYGSELLRSLEAFLEQNGHWERAARQLDCHRHTLRYRIRRIEELTGRDLSRAHDRIEFWLALRARELVA